MPSLDDLPESPILHVMVYGPPKCGKTWLVGQLAESGKKLIWFDLERGVSTLRKLSPAARKNVEVIQIPDNKQTPMAIETCLKVIKGAPVKVCHEHGKVTCPICMKAGAPMTEVHLNSLGEDYVVVFDSLSQLTASAIANITRGKPDDYKLERDDWGNLGKLMDTFLSFVQSAPFNVVCISHESMVDTVDKMNQKIVPVAGTSNFSRNCAKFFDSVVYGEVKMGKHTFASSTTHKPKILTGSRTGTPMEKSDEPKLIDLWEN